ncbi:MAG: hypothetical protein GY850_40890 [bacterium]|nr:hypothetical protein [bacterium]
MDIRVETYSGYKADEYPKRISIDEKQLEIIDIEDRWYGPDYAYYKIFADDGKRYILRQDLSDSQWNLQTFISEKGNIS